MKLFHVRRELYLDRDLDEVFAFFSDPRNLQQITPPWLRFEIKECTDAPVVAGTEIRYGLRVHGLPLSWRSRITVWDPPHVFVDKQLSGPYRRWVHTHRFERRGAGTLVTDHVEYAVLGGAVVNRLFVRKDVEAIFDYRTHALGELFGGAQGDDQPASSAPAEGGVVCERQLHRAT